MFTTKVQGNILYRVSVVCVQVLCQSLNLATTFVYTVKHFHPGNPPFIHHIDECIARSVMQVNYYMYMRITFHVTLLNACSFNKSKCDDNW